MCVTDWNKRPQGVPAIGVLRGWGAGELDGWDSPQTHPGNSRLGIQSLPFRPGHPAAALPAGLRSFLSGSQVRPRLTPKMSLQTGGAESVSDQERARRDRALPMSNCWQLKSPPLPSRNQEVPIRLQFRPREQGTPAVCRTPGFGAHILPTALRCCHRSGPTEEGTE